MTPPKPALIKKSSAATSLTTIPREILDAILHHVDQHSLYSLVRCSQSLHNLGLAHLYRNISLSEVPYKTDFMTRLHGNRFERSRVTIPRLYDLTCRIVDHPLLACHVRGISIVPHCIYSHEAERIGPGIKVFDVDERLHELVRRASSSRRRHKLWMRQIRADRDSDVVLALLIASLPFLQSLSLHFRHSFNKALRHLVKIRKDTTVYSLQQQQPLGRLRHISHLHPDDCGENCFIEDRADFPMAILLQCPSVERISGQYPWPPYQISRRGYEFPEAMVSSLKELSLDYHPHDYPHVMPWFIPRAIEVSPQLRSLELRLCCHEEIDTTDKIFRALMMVVSTLETLALEQYSCYEHGTHGDCHARRSLKRIFPLTHFERLTSLKLGTVFIFGVSRMHYWTYRDGVLQTPDLAQLARYCQDSLSDLLPPNVERLCLRRYEREIPSLLHLNVESLLMSAAASFPRLRRS